MQNITKAVVLAAGRGLRSLPATKAVPKALLTIFDRPAIQWVCEEAAASGAKEILVVVSGADAVQKHFEKDEGLERLLSEQNKLNELAGVRALSRLNVVFARQQNAGGSGEALQCARAFVGDKPFFLLNCDDLFLCEKTPACAKLAESYSVTGMATVGAVRRAQGLQNYGVLKIAQREDGESRLLEIIEKPEDAVSPALIAAGRYIFNPSIFEVLDKTPRFGDELRLSDAVAILCRIGAVCAAEIEGKRFDVGKHVGCAAANAAYALRFAEKEFKDELNEAGIVF